MPSFGSSTINDTIAASTSPTESSTQNDIISRSSEIYTEESLLPPDYLPAPKPLLAEDASTSTAEPQNLRRKKRQLVRTLQQTYATHNESQSHQPPRHTYYTSFHYKLLPPKSCTHIKSIRNLLLPLRTIRRPSRELRELLLEGEHSLESIMQRFSHDSHLEENRFHYSATYVEKRNKLLTNPDILRNISPFWNRLSFDDLYIEKTVFFYFWHCCYDVLIREGFNEHVEAHRRIIIDELDELEAIDADYQHDCKGDTHGVRYEWFFLSLLELADNWVFSTNPADYKAFLHALYVRVFNSKRGFGGADDTDLGAWSKKRKRRRKGRKSRPTTPTAAGIETASVSMDMSVDEEAQMHLGHELQRSRSIKIPQKHPENLQVINLTKSLTPITPADEYETISDHTPFPIAGAISPEEKMEELKRAIEQSQDFQHMGGASDEGSKRSPLNKMLNRKPVRRSEMWRANSGILTLSVPLVAKSAADDTTENISPSEDLVPPEEEHVDISADEIRRPLLELDDRQSLKDTADDTSETPNSVTGRNYAKTLDQGPTPWNTQPKRMNLLDAFSHGVETLAKKNIPPRQKGTPKPSTLKKSTKKVIRTEKQSSKKKNKAQPVVSPHKQSLASTLSKNSGENPGRGGVALGGASASTLVVPQALQSLEHDSPLRRFIAPSKAHSDDLYSLNRMQELSSISAPSQQQHPVAFQDTDDLNVILAHLNRREPMVSRMRPLKQHEFVKKRTLNTDVGIVKPFTETRRGLLTDEERKRIQEEIYLGNHAVISFGHNPVVDRPTTSEEK